MSALCKIEIDDQLAAWEEHDFKRRNINAKYALFGQMSAGNTPNLLIKNNKLSCFFDGKYAYGRSKGPITAVYNP